MFLPPLAHQVWVPSHRVSLKSIQKVVGHSHNLYDTITPVYLPSRLLLAIGSVIVTLMLTFSSNSVVGPF